MTDPRVTPHPLCTIGTPLHLLAWQKTCLYGLGELLAAGQYSGEGIVNLFGLARLGDHSVRG
jgi:hypothetical protein